MASLMAVQFTTRRFASLLCQTTLVSSQCRMSLAPHTVSGIVQVAPVHPLKGHATCASLAIRQINPTTLTWASSPLATLNDDTVIDRDLYNYIRDSSIRRHRETLPCVVDFSEDSLSHNKSHEFKTQVISDIELDYMRDLTKRAGFTNFAGNSGILWTSSPEMECMRFSNTVNSSEKTGTGSSKGDGKDQPNADHLNNIKNFMIETIPTVLSKQHEYRIYTSDLVFENNWTIDKPYTVVGLTAYALKLFKARFYIHFKYAKVKVSILSATIDIPDSKVIVRWRIAGLPQIKAFMFWKYVPFKVKSKGSEESEWLDGLSTFYVDSSGFIRKHRIDKVIADKDFATSAAKVIVKPALGLQGT